ncbi:MAG: wax ester/triacylglycerol synthase family O-acyltransferase [Acidimicrobiia bacterium]|nr:wax ester/triacylglycerol synthase family O-acyltransferase [Acidimicrobiia bacterium]
MAQREREMRFDDRMSDHEALMWNVEKDPWLNPSGGAIAILDGPIDEDHFRRTMRAAITKLPRLFERVVPGLAGLTPPAWVPDPEFDLDFHSRHVSLPAPGTERQLFDLATQLYQEPFDRTRPLWRFVLIDGLVGGRSAIWSMMHHSISDGIGQLRMAEMYQQVAPDEPAPDEVDLEGIIAVAAAEHSAKEAGGDLSQGLSSSAAKSLSHLIRRQAGLARRAAGELAIWPADPRRAKDSLDKITGTASSAVGDLTGSGNEVEGGSELWKARSRHRHLEHVVVPLDELKAASKRRGVSINDLFLTGMTEGAVRYHADRGVEVEAFNTSFVISTRTDNAIGGNSFAPVLVQVPGTEMKLQRRIDEISERLAAKRDGASSGTSMSALSGLAKFLPTSVLTNLARSAAGKIDFATSNLRGAPFDLYVSGARVVSIVAMGPVAGTGCNATAMSYVNEFGIGLFIDPVAIDSPGDFRDAIDGAFTDILAD